MKAKILAADHAAHDKNARAPGACAGGFCRLCDKRQHGLEAHVQAGRIIRAVGCRAAITAVGQTGKTDSHDSLRTVTE
jgi:hypothetical protein